MKLLIVADDYLPKIGGVSAFIHGIAESTALAGHQVLVLAPDMPGKDDTKQNYRVRRFKKTKRLANLWPSLITIYLSIVNKFDVILYGHVASTLSTGGMLARKLNLTRLAVLTHGNDLDYSAASNIDKYFLYLLISNADIVLANSNYTREKINKRYPNAYTKIKILNPGVWAEQICSSGATINKSVDDIVILTVARLVPKKGIDDLIKAFSLVNAKCPKAILKIVGDGPEKCKPEEITRQLGLKKNVNFMGAKPANEVYAEMKQCSFFVLPSKDVDGDVETFGIVYLEANACGKAVIGTRQGGVPDAVVDGVTGVLVEPGNVEQLAEAMLRLIENKELRDKIGQAGRERVKREFDWCKVADKLVKYLVAIK